MICDFESAFFQFYFAENFDAIMAKNERELPEILEIDFIICDNSVNRYYWRLLVNGIELDGFLKNPVCCVQHATYMIPVGKWKNLHVEGEDLKGTVEFDKNDDDAVKLYWKYKDGFMNAVSLNVIPIEESEDKELLLPGQKYATLVKSELIEISLVTIPGQKNAVKLSTPEGDEYKLHLITNKKKMDKDEKTVDQLKQELETQKKLNAENLVLRHKARGVVQDGELDSLKELAFSAYETVSKMLDVRQPAPTPKSEDTAETKAEALVALHFNRGAITEPEKAIYKQSATLDYDGTKKVLEAKQGTEGVQSFVQGMSSGSEQKQLDGDRAGWSYYDYFKKDSKALALMEKNEPEKYKKLVADFHAQNEDLGIEG